MKTAINRGTVAVIGMVLLAQIVLGLLAPPLGLTMAQVQVLVILAFALGAGVVTVLIERRIWPTAAAYCAGAVYLVGDPPSRNLVLTLTNLVFWINCAVIWRLSWRELREPRPGASLRGTDRSAKNGADGRVDER
jgi:hypothetical protein